MQMQGKIIC